MKNGNTNRGGCMLVVVFIFLLFLLILTILLIPINIKVYLKGGRIKLFWHKIKLFDQELKIIFDEEHIEKTKKYGKAYLKLLTKVNYKEMKLDIEGVNYQYSINPMYYGYCYGILSILQSYLAGYKIPLKYSLTYQGDSYIEFFGIIQVHLGRLLLEFTRIKGGKYERAPY